MYCSSGHKEFYTLDNLFYFVTNRVRGGMEWNGLVVPQIVDSV